MPEALKLNLGCGQNHRSGYVNVDKFGQPDLVCDLEQFPWPWADNTVIEVVLHHVLEHLGETQAIYLAIFQELYRVCQPNAVVKIAVPHPRHNNFLDDPTHVRAVTAEGLALFSQRNNRLWQEQGLLNTPLGLILGVDFEIIRLTYILEEPWLSRHRCHEITDEDLQYAERHYNNVFRSLLVDLQVIKPENP